VLEKGGKRTPGDVGTERKIGGEKITGRSVKRAGNKGVLWFLWLVVFVGCVFCFFVCFLLFWCVFGLIHVTCFCAGGSWLLVVWECFLKTGKSERGNEAAREKEDGQRAFVVFVNLVGVWFYA